MPSTKPTTTDAATLTDEIGKLRDSIDAVEQAGPPVDELVDRAVSQLKEAERFFAHHGAFTVQFAGNAAQQRYHDRLSLLGLLLANNPQQVRDAVTAQVRARFKADGAHGMSEAARQQRLGEMRADLRTLLAKRELVWRQSDSDDAFAARPGIDADAGEMFLMSDSDLREAAA